MTKIILRYSLLNCAAFIIHKQSSSSCIFVLISGQYIWTYLQTSTYNSFIVFTTVVNFNHFLAAFLSKTLEARNYAILFHHFVVTICDKDAKRYYFNALYLLLYIIYIIQCSHMLKLCANIYLFSCYKRIFSSSLLCCWLIISYQLLYLKYNLTYYNYIQGSWVVITVLFDTITLILVEYLPPVYSQVILHIRVVWPGSILFADQLQILILIIPKNNNWQFQKWNVDNSI